MMRCSSVTSSPLTASQSYAITSSSFDDADDEEPCDAEAVVDVPYHYQSETDWCGQTVVAMVLRSYGIPLHRWDIADDLYREKERY